MSSPQENILVAPAPPALDPENRVAVLGLHQKPSRTCNSCARRAKLKTSPAWWVGSPTEPAGSVPAASQKLVAVFFHELAPVFEGETALALGQQREEEQGPLTHALQRA